MVKSNVIGTKAQLLIEQHVAEFKNLANKHIPSWSEFLLMSLLLLQYFILSVGFLRYRASFLTAWKYPLSLIVCHLLIKFLLTSLTRILLRSYNGKNSINTSYLKLSLIAGIPGIATAVDYTFSSIALGMPSPPIYIMTKSATVVSVLYFAVFYRLEKKSWVLNGIVLLISAGSAMFIYSEPSSAIDIFRLFFGLLASFFYGIHWTLSQSILQKSTLGLSNPIDIMYYMLPFTLLASTCYALRQEAFEIYNDLLITDWTDTSSISTTATILMSGTIAFLLELTQITIVSRASSLTLCVAEISKICGLMLAFESRINLMSDLNYFGLLTYYSGTILYIIFRLWSSTDEEDGNIKESTKSDAEKKLISSDESKTSTSGDFLIK